MDGLFFSTVCILAAIGCIVAFTFLILLVATKYNLALFIDILLLSVAFIEPSPSDIIFVFLFVFMWKSRKTETAILNARHVILAFLYLFILSNIISLYNLTNLIVGIKYLIITIYLVLYAVLIFRNVGMKNYKLIFTAYIISSTAAALIGISGYLLKIPVLTCYEFTRAKALFKDPNVFGPFLVPAVILLLSILKEKRQSKVVNLIIIAAIIINSIGILISFSRGAYVNFLIAIIIYFIFSYKEMRLKRLVLYSVVFLLFFGVLWAAIADDNFKDFFAHRVKLQGYDLERFKVQQSGLSIAKGRLFGYGPGQYELTVERAMDFRYSAHSLYIRVILENGILGFLILIAFLTILLFFLLRICLYQIGSRKDAGIVLMAILCGILINGIVVDTLHWRHLWLFVGMSIRLISEQYYLGNTDSAL